AQAAVESEAFGALTAELRRAEATTTTSRPCFHASSRRADSTTLTTSPRSFTTGSPVPPLAPPDQDGPAKRPGSSLGSCHTRAEYTTPRCVRRSMSEKHSSKPAPTPFLMALSPTRHPG